MQDSIADEDFESGDHTEDDEISPSLFQSIYFITGLCRT
jgi:hypothetical protein